MGPPSNLFDGVTKDCAAGGGDSRPEEEESAFGGPFVACGKRPKEWPHSDAGAVSEAD